MRKMIMAAAMVACSGSVLADDFDVTMDVIGVDESLDDAIVNRISLPFSVHKGAISKAPQGMVRRGIDDELRELVEAQLDGAGMDQGAGVSGSEVLTSEDVPSANDLNQLAVQ